MKYIKFFSNQGKKILKGLSRTFFAIFIYIFIFIIFAAGNLEDYNINLNSNDYCNLTDVEYEAVLQDEPLGRGKINITEYLTYDIHAASSSNKFKEVWRELPEEEIDGVKVTYDVKSVTQILPDGREIPYLETNKMYWEDEDYNESSMLRWHHSDGNGVYPDNDESVLIYIPWTYRDKLKFKIEYSMNNAALKYNDCSELYLSLYSGRTIKKLNSYKANILVPKDIMPNTYYAYTFGTSKDRIPFSESDSIKPGYHTFSINLSKEDLKFNLHNRYIEFCLLAYGKDKHIFTKYAPDNIYSHDDVLDELIAENEYYTNKNGKYRNYKYILLIISIIGSLGIVVFTKKKYKDLKGRYSVYKPDYNFDIYKNIPSDLDPIFASELVFINDPFNTDSEKGEEYAAILLSLVRKKYVTITKKNESLDWTDDNTLITIQAIQSNYNTPEDNSYNVNYTTIDQTTGMALEELTTSERLYYELLEKYARVSNNQITVKQLQICIDGDYLNTKNFIKDMEKKPALENGVMLGYFQDAHYDIHRKKFLESAKVSIILGILILILGNGISCFTPMGFGFGAYTIIAIAFIWKYLFEKEKADEFILLTQFGANEQAKWRGLYNYLNSDEFKNNKDKIDVNLLEKYLIYATAFGISDKAITSIKFHSDDETIENSSILNRHFYIHSHHFHHTSRSFGHAIHTPARGGGFGGHGYGGGGRGGGGGGGGH